MATATPITSKAELDAAISESNSKPVTVYLYAGEVAPELRTRFQESAPSFADKVGSYKCDLEACADVKSALGANAEPALVVFKGGKEVERVVKPGESDIKDIIVRVLS